MAVWKQLLLLCLLGGLGYGGWWVYKEHYAPPKEAAAERPNAPAPVEIVPAERQVLETTVEAVGTTRALQSVEIVPEAAGRIVEITFNPGDRVEKGEVLVRLDDAIQRADLAVAAARSTEQDQVLARARQLRETNAISQATLEESVARLAEAGAQLDRARRRLEDRTITAPFAGVVGLTEVDPGARVSEGDLITRLDDLSEVIVEFALPETLFAQVRTGLSVTATSAAFPDRNFEGRIAAVDSRIDPVSRSFLTRAVIPNRNSVLPAGMFMSLTLTLSESEELVVPEAAIIFQAAETYVFTVTDGTAHRVPVRTGQRRAGLVAIEGGLEEGTGVVVRGLQRVRDGAAVTVLDAGEPSGTTATEGDS
ncbi:MAG: efflux RND transporter periplasmic adaptor subunit [Roseovarius sp.]